MLFGTFRESLFSFSILPLAFPKHAPSLNLSPSDSSILRYFFKKTKYRDGGKREKVEVERGGRSLKFVLTNLRVFFLQFLLPGL